MTQEGARLEFEIDLGDRVAGVDEVGRGPLAGPVVAAAVILDARCPITGWLIRKPLARRDESNLRE